MTSKDPQQPKKEKPPRDLEREDIGKRIAYARSMAGHTQQSAAEALTAGGLKFGKAAVSAWEKGRNLPGPVALRRLARLYGTTADSLLQDNYLSADAVKIAMDFDALSEPERKRLKAKWPAFLQTATKEEVAQTGAEERSPFESPGEQSAHPIATRRKPNVAR